MNRETIGIAAGLLMLAPLVTQTAAAPPVLSDWSTVATFKADGSLICSLRFSVPKGSQTLSLENRDTKKMKRESPYFTLAGLPPMLAGKKGAIRDITVTVGTTSIPGVKADWSHGSSDANSRIGFFLETDFGRLLAALRAGGTFRVALPDSVGGASFSFDLSGAGGAVNMLRLCLNAG